MPPLFPADVEPPEVEPPEVVPPEVVPPGVLPVVPVEFPDSLIGSHPFTLSKIPSTTASPAAKEPPANLLTSSSNYFFLFDLNSVLKEAFQQ